MTMEHTAELSKASQLANGIYAYLGCSFHAPVDVLSDQRIKATMEAFEDVEEPDRADLLGAFDHLTAAVGPGAVTGKMEEIFRDLWPSLEQSRDEVLGEVMDIMAGTPGRYKNFREPLPDVFRAAFNDSEDKEVV